MLFRVCPVATGSEFYIQFSFTSNRTLRSSLTVFAVRIYSLFRRPSWPDFDLISCPRNIHDWERIQTDALKVVGPAPDHRPSTSSGMRTKPLDCQWRMRPEIG